jgi:hypothetical protein
MEMSNTSNELHCSLVFLYCVGVTLACGRFAREFGCGSTAHRQQNSLYLVQSDLQRDIPDPVMNPNNVPCSTS